MHGANIVPPFIPRKNSSAGDPFVVHGSCMPAPDEESKIEVQVGKVRLNWHLAFWNVVSVEGPVCSLPFTPSSNAGVWFPTHNGWDSPLPPLEWQCVLFKTQLQNDSLKCPVTAKSVHFSFE